MFDLCRNVWPFVLGFLVFLVLWSHQGGVSCASDGLSPTQIVKSTIDRVIEIVTDDELKQAGQGGHRRVLLEETISEHFSFWEMGKRSLAKYWKGRSPEERVEFIDLFKSLLAKTYAGKIETYSGEEIQYLKERYKNASAEVQTRIISPKTEVSLYYRLLKKDGTWMVYDVVVNGVSLVKNYRSQFARIIRRSSYQELINTLREKSQEITAP